jgi:hypothetical protein
MRIIIIIIVRSTGKVVIREYGAVRYTIAGTGAKDETTVLESSKRGWLGEWTGSRVGMESSMILN